MQTSEAKTHTNIDSALLNDGKDTQSGVRRNRQRSCESCSTDLLNTGRVVDNMLLCDGCCERYNEHHSRCTACAYIPSSTELAKKFCTKCRGGTWLVAPQTPFTPSNTLLPSQSGPNYSVATTERAGLQPVVSIPTINVAKRGRKPGYTKVGAPRGRKPTNGLSSGHHNNTNDGNGETLRSIAAIDTPISLALEQPLETSQMEDTTDTESSQQSDEEMAASL